MSTITKEHVANLLQFNSEGSDCQANAEQWEVHELARIALASLEAEAVGFIARHKETGKFGSYLHPKADWFKNDEYEVLSAYTAPPAPVSVPECFKRLLHHAYGMTMGYDWNKGTMAGHHRAKLCQAVEECRAVMLQGGENSESTTTLNTAPALDSLPKIAQSTSGNSPVIPEGWVACSERMPEDARWCAVSTEYGYYVQCWSDGQGWLGDEISIPNCDVTHWMPLPAAPQQEAKNV